MKPHALRLALLALALPAGLGSCMLCRPEPPHYEPFVTAAGVQVQDVVVPEAGAVATPGDQVTIDYAMRLASGELVDSSRERGTPASFVLGTGRVPAGLEDGILGMRVGGRRKLRVPPELGFGSAGRPPRIPPDATLLFHVELLDVQPAGTPPAERPPPPAPAAKEPETP